MTVQFPLLLFYISMAHLLQQTGIDGLLLTEDHSLLPFLQLSPSVPFLFQDLIQNISFSCHVSLACSWL